MSYKPTLSTVSILWQRSNELLVAYRQPVTRGDIELVRGVAVSTDIIRGLQERGWIAVIGHRDVPGRPALYSTTKHFLDYFNLSSLHDLPPLKEIKNFMDFEPDMILASQEVGEFDIENASKKDS